MSIRLALIFAALFTPAVASAQPGDDPTSPDADPTTRPDSPPIVIKTDRPQRATMYTTEAPRYETYYESWNRPLFTSGAVVFLGSYGAALVVAGTSEDDAFDRGNDNLYIPIAGPWLALNDRPDCGLLYGCENEDAKKALLVVDGVLQGAGAITMIAALLQPRETRVLANPTASRTFRVTPTVRTGGPGFVMSGNF